MPTVADSKVTVEERTDSLIFNWEKCSSPCPQRKMPSSEKLDDNDQYDGNFTDKLVKFSHSSGLDKFISEEFKEELFRISDKMIDFHAKVLLNDSGTDCFSLPDSEEEEEEEEETSLHNGNGTLSKETTDLDREVQDERGLDDVNRGMLNLPYDISASQDGKTGAEDSCEMTYIELDLSSQSNQDVSREEFTDMMKNLIITPSKVSVDPDSFKFVPCDTKDHFDENNLQDLEPKESAEKLGLNLESEKVVNFNHNSGNNVKSEKVTKFLGSFLPIRESSLSSLPERTYVQIAEYLLDERMPLRLNVEEKGPSSSGSCRTTLFLTPNNLLIPSEVTSSNVDLKLSPIPNETPSYKTCPMTYVDLDISEPCSNDETIKMFNDLSIKDDKISLPRGNPSEQNGIPNHSLCSQIDLSDFQVPAVDNSPFLLGMTTTEIDLNLFTNSISSGSVQDFYHPQSFPSSSTAFDFTPTTCLPSIPNESIAQNLKTFSEANPIEEQMLSEQSFWESSPFPAMESSLQYGRDPLDISFCDHTLENSEMPFEHEFVSKNLHKLQEIIEILGLPRTENEKTTSPPLPPPPPPSPPPFSSNNLPHFFSRPVCETNVGAMQNSFPTNSQSIDRNVIPSVTTQTPGTQSDAIPALSGIWLVFPTSSVPSSKRPPVKKPFGYDNQNNSALSEVDSKKKAKEWVASLTDRQLFIFEDKESLLHKTVRTADSEYVLALLKRLTSNSCDVDILNSKNENFQTPLHLAVQENIPAIVHLLIRHGAEVNHLAVTPSKKLEAPLHYVASRGNKFKLVFKCLLEANDLDINIKNSEGQTALHCAAAAHRSGGFNSTHSIDSEYIIKKLLAYRADPLIQDNTGKNLLMYVIESKDLNLMSHIMKTVSKEEMHKLLTDTTTNGQTFLSLTQSLKEQFNQVQWEKVINMLTRHT